MADEHQAVRWKHGSDPALEERLTRSFSSEPQEDGRDIVSWTCPRCFHSHRQSVDREGWVSGLVSRPTKREGTLAIVCDCQQAHDARPENGTGCGYRALLLVEVGDE